MLTGHVENRIQELARESGCAGFLRKPVHLDDLVREVQRVLSLPRRILVVEDDADVRETMSDALMQRGYDVATAINGLDAIHWLRDDDAPDAILLDLVMPVMSGWDFLAEQKEDPMLAGIPVIIVTAARGARGGLETQTLLEKPVTLTQLVGALDSAHSRH